MTVQTTRAKAPLFRGSLGELEVLYGVCQKVEVAVEGPAREGISVIG